MLSSLSRRPGFLRIINDRTYDIEFNGYLSNHAKHAIIALEKLEASHDRVDQYWEEYTTLNLPSHKIGVPWEDIKPCTTKEWTQLRGKKENWPGMCFFLENELLESCDQDVNKLVKIYAPDLLSGLSGALTHGIIHLGWALDAVDSENPWMVIEGIAYLNFCHVSVHPENFVHSAFEEKSAVDSLIRVASTWEKENLAENWVGKAKSKYNENSGFHSELIPAGFQWELSKILQEQHAVAYKLPTWLDTKSIPEIFEDLYKTVIIMYLVTADPSDGHGNFFILHLISSLWGLEQVLNVVQEDEIARNGLKCYYSSLICLVAANGGGFPSPNAIQKTAQELFEVDENHKELEDFFWPNIVARGTQETEEHNIKLVYVGRELWRRYGYWTGFRKAAETFTLPPNIGPTATTFKA
jgi:hypothetical protein